MSALISTLQKLGFRGAAASERRLHNRALLYWQDLPRGQQIPLIEAFDFLQLENDAAHGFLLEVNAKGEALLSYVGDILREEAELRPEASNLDEVPAASLLGQFGRRWERVVEERQPVASEYDFDTAAGYRVYCRGVLLPLSTDGVTVDRICGVVSWKSEKVQPNLSDANLPPQRF